MATSLFRAAQRKLGEDLLGSEVGREAREEGIEQVEVKKQEHNRNYTQIELEEGELPVELKEETEEGELTFQPTKLDRNIVKGGNKSKEYNASFSIQAKSTMTNQEAHSTSTNDLIKRCLVQFLFISG